MEIVKSGMISIVGRPNVGKSTLMNTLIGEKIAIVSNKPQTTRNRIFGVLNRDGVQYVFIDTPGLHKPATRLGEYMVKVTKDSVADVDAVVMLVEPVDRIGKAEEALLEYIRACKSPAILIINKIDTVKPEEIFSIIDLYKNMYDFKAIIPISAKTGDGVEALIKELSGLIPEGVALFPEDMISDQPEKQVIAEIIREKLLTLLNKEIPHGIAIEITKFSERDSGIIDLDATIYCEKESHKGIIIGKKGAMLKRVGELSRIDIEAFMGTKVFMQLWVKVKEGWRNNAGLIRNFGYE